METIYGLLGTIWISGLDRPPRPLVRRLFAVLLINPNHLVSRDTLKRLVWEEDAENVRDSQLDNQVAKLRATLRRIARDTDLEIKRGVGYLIRIAVDDLDTTAFREAVRRADVMHEQKRDDEELYALRTALDLWRGDIPLADVPGGPLDQSLVDEWARRRRIAATRLFEIEMGRGNHEHIREELGRMFHAYPTDEDLTAQFMKVLDRCHRVTEAADVYIEHRDALRDQLGTQPSTAIRQLRDSIVKRKARAIAALFPDVAPAAGSFARPAVIRPRQLPLGEPLVGRDTIMAELTWLLAPRKDRPGIITIVGQPGIGKTAVALAAAHAVAGAFPDGQFFAKLRDTTGRAVDTAEILAQFLRALGESHLPESLEERQALWRTLTADRQVLVVLDDAVDGRQVSDLTPASPRCAIVVTAPQRLPDASGNQHEPPLETLSPEDGHRLFRRTVAAGGIMLPPEDDPHINRVVKLCGGLPLALRIAGAHRVRSNLRTTAQLAEDLTRKPIMKLSFGGMSVARSIEASADRLSPAAHRLLLSLGLTRLPHFARWVGHVLGAPVEPSETALEELDSWFMLERLGDTRHKFHDLTRRWAQYTARQRMGDEAQSMVAPFYRALLSLLRLAHRAIYGSDFDVIHGAVTDWSEAPKEVLAEVAADPTAWFEKEHPNIRAAVQHCAELGLVEMCWDLALSAHEFYTRCGLFDDWYATHVTALEACRAADNRRGEGILLVSLGQPSLVSSRPSGAVSGLPELERAVALLTEVDDRHGRAIAMRTLANALRREGHLARPLALFEEALLLYGSEDPVGQWQALRFVGQTYLDLRRYKEALKTLRRAERSAVALRESRPIGQSRYWVGQALLAVGDLPRATKAFGSVWKIFGTSSGADHAYARHGLGDLAIRQGRYAEAKAHLEAAAEAARRGRDTILEGRAWLSMADLRRAQGKRTLEREALHRAEVLFPESGARYLLIRTLAALAEVSSKRGAARLRAEIKKLYHDGGIDSADQIYS